MKFFSSTIYIANPHMENHPFNGRKWFIFFPTCAATTANQPLVPPSWSVPPFVTIFYVNDFDIDFQFTNFTSDKCFVCFHSSESGANATATSPPILSSIIIGVQSWIKVGFFEENQMIAFDGFLYQNSYYLKSWIEVGVRQRKMDFFINTVIR